MNSNDFTLVELKRFATKQKIPNRSKAKNKAEFMKLIISNGYGGKDIQETESLVEFVKNKQNLQLADYYDTEYTLIKKELGKLPFSFSGTYLLERLDDPIYVGQDKITILDGRVRKSPPLVIENLNNLSITPREIISHMKKIRSIY